MAGVTTNTGGNEFLARVYNCKGGPEALRSIYDEWSSTFDHDVGAQDYVSPILVASAIADRITQISAALVLDAGCGTGLSGVALSKVGAKHIDGIDLSQGMLEHAVKTGVYRSLDIANLAEAIPQKASEQYDVVTCVGTLTHGHVGPDPALAEFTRVLKQGGIFAGTILDDIWISGGYETSVMRLEANGQIEVLSIDSVEYRKKAGVTAKLLVFRKR